MNKNPFLNAVFAAAYIVIIVLVMNKFSSVSPPEDSIFAPMTMISLLVLSVAIMGFLFVYEPVRLIIENKKQEAVTFFTKTILTFACFVILFVLLLLSSF